MPSKNTTPGDQRHLYYKEGEVGGSPPHSKSPKGWMGRGSKFKLPRSVPTPFR